MFLPRMQKLEAQFINYTGAFPDEQTPICDRFGMVYKAIPELTSVSISSDLTPLWQEALDKWEGQRLLCAADLCRLRYHLYDQIYRNNMCFMHTLVYEQAACELWLNKLMAKIVAMKQARRQGGRIRKAYVPVIHAPHWLN